MKRIIIIDVGLTVILIAAIILLINGTTRGEVPMEREYKIPPIDAGRPAVTETATFSLG